MMKSTVGELVAILEKLPANAEVSILAKGVTAFGTEHTSMEPIDLTPVDGANPEHYSSSDVQCLSTRHIQIHDSRNIKGIAPMHRKVTVEIGGILD